MSWLGYVRPACSRPYLYNFLDRSNYFFQRLGHTLVANNRLLLNDATVAKRPQLLVFLLPMPHTTQYDSGRLTTPHWTINQLLTYFQYLRHGRG